MAQKTQMVLVDDLDGTPAGETTRFGLDGRHYEIDLSTEHARELGEYLKEYVRQARAVNPPARRQQTAKIRIWALQNGYEVGRRGRIHRDVVEAYHRSQQ